MSTLQKAFDDALDQLPRQAAEQLLREKLAALDVRDEALLARLVDQVLHGAEGLEAPDGERLSTSKSARQALESA